MSKKPFLTSLLLSGFLFSPAAFADEPKTPAQPAAPVQPTTQAQQAATSEHASKDSGKADKADKERLAREKAEQAQREKEEKAERERAEKEQKKNAAKQEKEDKKSKADAKEHEFTSVPLTEFIKRPDMKATWGSLFKSEYVVATWIQGLDADSQPITQLAGSDGVNYIFGQMNKTNEYNERLLVLITEDHKKAWGLGVVVPLGLSKEAYAHPKKYGNLRWYGKPDANIRKVLMEQLEKDPKWK